LKRSFRSLTPACIAATMGLCLSLATPVLSDPASDTQTAAATTPAPVATKAPSQAPPKAMPPSPAPAPTRTQTAKPPGPQRTSVEVANAFYAALKVHDYGTAYEMFSTKMKAAVPEENLQVLWLRQVDQLGHLVTWTTYQGAAIEGRDVLVSYLKFEQGELRGTVLVTSKTGDLAGFYLQVPPGKPLLATAPPAYIDTTKFHSMDAAVGAEPLLLSGTLTVPVGSGPFPAVVLVHGSGANDRDETVGPNKLFKDLAEGLSSRGIIVLRYDKRTFQYGSKLSTSLTIDDEVVYDAMSAVQVLRARHDVDTTRIYVIGHSLGGLLAPEIGVRSGNVAGVALLAPPGRPPWELILSQMRFAKAPQAQLTDVERKIGLIKQGKLGDERLFGSPQSYWLDWAGRDGVIMAKKFGRPVLVMRGDRDFQVEDVDLDTWRAGLDGVPNTEVVSMPKLNHLFMAGEGEPNAAEYNVARHADPSVINKLSAFVLAPPPHTAQAEAPNQSPDQPVTHGQPEGTAAGAEHGAAQGQPEHGTAPSPTHESGTPNHEGGTSESPSHDAGTSSTPTHDSGTPR